ncbi:GWxTD domain-containing protein [Flammeovirga yaeyamensis]|uniref:GWxTD domain-containing protein n=1 Tax=Flammeovirga yaeyamensis TaxID=367791 RepID=A0AAX1N304_9BACT|nr:MULTISPECIES: GWxTD domain-containing protein [Flammeovirga]ANQ50744.1 GWxTD domain-containing protein [Flammeovirga sp. MY04]MBB3701082.1 GWxTD domain-containing protein [Flammeovirga yaeyamensis]NMF38089.1 GWxTD domain-containing protein [Flammeovirga yaeyamensis]QWG01861.1 GWxTD domain-containing protein [Flammeovirga yaeyamensis]
MRQTTSIFYLIFNIILITQTVNAQNSFSIGLSNNTNYAKPGETFSVKGNPGTPYFVYHFSTDFMPAPPPMVENANMGNPMIVDTTFQVTANETISVNKKGLYFIQSDTTAKAGEGFIGVTEDFPKYRKMKNIYPTMVYISTQNEMMSFVQGERPRLAFENFWLNVAGSPDNAKRLIKLYFERVTEANIKFTDYKEGWKTDRGIIYIIFGSPDTISNIDGGIRWSYNSNLNHGQVEFDFFEEDNQFTGSHYELKRSYDYKRIWFDTVKKWRNGTLQ